MSPTALIIDDNKLNNDVLSTLLEQYEVQAIAIETPRHIADTLAQTRFDVVFLDLEFPQGNGFALLEELRAYPQLHRVPIIAYTVHTSEIDKARRLGFDGFVGKPIDPHRFSYILDRILSGLAVWELP